MPYCSMISMLLLCQRKVYLHNTNNLGDLCRIQGKTYLIVSSCFYGSAIDIPVNTPPRPLRNGLPVSGVDTLIF